MIKIQDNSQHPTQNLIQSYCHQGNQAELVCCTPNCMENAFICIKKDCKCFSSIHLNCNIKKLSNIIKRVKQRRNTINPILFNLYDAIKTIYHESIERLIADSKDLKNNMVSYGLTSIENEFYDLMLAKKQAKINGNFMSDLKDNLQATKDEPPNIEQQIVEQLWEAKKHFSVFCDSLKSMSRAEHIKKCSNPISQTIDQKKSLTVSQTVMQSVLRFQDIQIDSNIAQYSSLICSFFQKNVKKLKLLYRASQHDFSAEKYHSLCDQVPDTLVLLQTKWKTQQKKGVIFGGYTPLKFSIFNTIDQVDVSQTSFLFSLTNRSKFPLKVGAKAIVNQKGYGPIFGSRNNPDLVISDKANIEKNSNCLGFPTSYKKQKSSIKSFYGTKKGPFYLQQWQVFQVCFD